MKRARKLDAKLMQRVNILFLVKLGWDARDIITALSTVYGDDSLSITRIRHWHKAFAQGRTTIVDLQRTAKERTGRSPANITKVKALIEADRRLTIRSLSKETGLTKSVVNKILKKDLCLQRKTAKYVPHLLTPLNLRCRLEICQMMLRVIRNKPSLLRRIVTMDESYVYLYDPELKQQSTQWLAKGDPRPQKVRRERAVGKTLLISFFDWKGVVHHEYLRNQTVTTTIFLGMLARLKQAMKTRRPRVKFQLHMDNASPHTALDTQLFLIHNGIRSVPHPPYSPDLAPNDFFFLSKIEEEFAGKAFPDSG